MTDEIYSEYALLVLPGLFILVTIFFLNSLIKYKSPNLLPCCVAVLSLWMLCYTKILLESDEAISSTRCNGCTGILIHLELITFYYSWIQQFHQLHLISRTRKLYFCCIRCNGFSIMIHFSGFQFRMWYGGTWTCL
jgi:hypothetical protein